MKQILNKVNEYYTHKVNEFGATPKGVDWKDEDSQLLRFNKLLSLIEGDEKFDIADLGCGYGKLYEVLASAGYDFKYIGYDLSESMIEFAEKKEYKNAEFNVIEKTEDVAEADYIVASGIFNVKMQIFENEWEKYVYQTLNVMFEKCKKGFACNFLTSYSDAEYMKDNLFYPSPSVIFDYCKANLSKYVTVMHDYPLYEFTLIVRRFD